MIVTIQRIDNPDWSESYSDVESYSCDTVNAEIGVINIFFKDKTQKGLEYDPQLYRVITREQVMTDDNS